MFKDRHGEDTSIGRGNLSFTTINLPGLAIEAALEAQERTGIKFELGRGSEVNMIATYKKAVKKIFLKKLEEYALYQNNDKLSYVLASDIAFFIKFKGAVAVSTIDKMLAIDLFNYQVSKENKEKVKILVYEKLEKYFNILPIEIDVRNYDDSEFINAYLKKS